MKKYYLNWPNEKKRNCAGIIVGCLWGILLLLFIIISFPYILLLSTSVALLILSIIGFGIPIIYAINNYFWYNDETNTIILHIYRMKTWEISLSIICTLEETQNRDYSKGAVSGRANTVYAVKNAEKDVLFYVNGADSEILNFFRNQGVPILNNF